MKNKLPISGVIITLNAASHLEKTLSSLSQFCDELVVVDSGSTDDTIKIAKEFDAQVVNHPWEGYGPQKDFAVSLTKNDWVFCLDADETVSMELAQAIQTIFGQSLPAHLAGFQTARCNTFLGRFLKHGEGYPDFIHRLFHKQRAYWSHDLVHEKVKLRSGFMFKRIQGDILHFSAENLDHYLDKQNRYTNIQAQQLVKNGKRPSLIKLIGSPMTRFIKFYLLRRGFLDGWQGFVHIVIGCFFCMMKYAKTRALLKTKS